ncbi:unnamed protein product, partial [Mycena citricolor]
MFRASILRVSCSLRPTTTIHRSQSIRHLRNLRSMSSLNIVSTSSAFPSMIAVQKTRHVFLSRRTGCCRPILPGNQTGRPALL